MNRGFYITAQEMREVGIRVHDNISDHTVFRPPSCTAFFDRFEIARRYRADHLYDGKFAEQTGDSQLAAACRRVVDEIDAVIAIWRARWRENTHG